MKAFSKLLFGVFFLGLIIANVSTFVSSIVLGSKINYYEIETRKLHQQNIELEKKAYQVSSYQSIASEAARLNFVKKVEPMYIDNLPVARSQ